VGATISRPERAFALAAVACILGCGGTPNSVANDAAPDDAGPIDAALPDARVDADVTDGGPLRSTLGEPPYVIGNPAGTDIRDSVVGGEPPYECAVYAGPAPGTVPIGIQGATETSGCVFNGGVDVAAGDAPGAYGFIVIVTDRAGASIDIPIAYEGPGCTAGNATVEPATWPVPVNPPGSAFDLSLEVTELDGVEGPGGCGPCFDLSLLTRRPLVASTGLRCDAEGDLCSDCEDCITSVGECPGPNIGTVLRTVDLRDHAPLRPDGPGWATLSLDASYSGANADPCGTERFRCHFEVLELP